MSFFFVEYSLFASLNFRETLKRRKHKKDVEWSIRLNMDTSEVRRDRLVFYVIGTTDTKLLKGL